MAEPEVASRVLNSHLGGARGDGIAPLCPLSDGRPLWTRCPAPCGDQRDAESWHCLLGAVASHPVDVALPPGYFPASCAFPPCTRSHVIRFRYPRAAAPMKWKYHFLLNYMPNRNTVCSDCYTILFFGYFSKQFRLSADCRTCNVMFFLSFSFAGTRQEPRLSSIRRTHVDNVSENK